MPPLASLCTQRRQQEQHQELQAERVKRMADAEREHQCFKAFVNSLDCHSQSALVLAINQGRAASVEVRTPVLLEHSVVGVLVAADVDFVFVFVVAVGQG
eukprot:318395-Pelagomonas_calceolata.AAC.2